MRAVLYDNLACDIRLVFFFSFQSFFGFGQSAEVDIVLDGQETRKTAEIKTEDGKKERYYLYFDGETVSGKVRDNAHDYRQQVKNSQGNSLRLGVLITIHTASPTLYSLYCFTVNNIDSSS